MPAESWPTGSEMAGRPTRLASVAKRITELSSVRSDAPHFRSCGLHGGRHPVSVSRMQPHAMSSTAVRHIPFGDQKLSAGRR